MVFTGAHKISFFEAASQMALVNCTRVQLHSEGINEVIDLQELFCIFAYLNNHMNLEMVFYPSLPDIDMNSFHIQYCNYPIYSMPG